MKQFNNLFKIKLLLSLLIKHCVKDEREKQFWSRTSPRKAQRNVFIRSNLPSSCRRVEMFTEMNKNLKEMNTKINNRLYYNNAMKSSLQRHDSYNAVNINTTMPCLSMLILANISLGPTRTYNILLTAMLILATLGLLDLQKNILATWTYRIYWPA